MKPKNSTVTVTVPDPRPPRFGSEMRIYRTPFWRNGPVKILGTVRDGKFVEATAADQALLDADGARVDARAEHSVARQAVLDGRIEVEGKMYDFALDRASRPASTSSVSSSRTLCARR
jgi:hypothetical protein